MGYGKHLRRNWFQSGLSLIEAQGNFTSGSTTLVITPSVAPQEGDVLMMQFATTNIMDPAADITPPAGWGNYINSSVTRTCLYVKTATAAEPSSYSFTIIGPKGWEYMNFRGIMPRGPVSNLIPLTHTTVPGTITLPSFNVDKPGIAVSVLGKSTTTIWTASAGWTTLSASGQAKAAYKIYTDIALAESLTWGLSPPGSTSTVLSTSTFLFPCKFNQN